MIEEDFKNTLSEYEFNSYHNDKVLENKKIKYSSGYRTNFKKIEENRLREEKIYNYYYNQYFLDSKKENEEFIFITFTINPKFNLKNCKKESTKVKKIKDQNELIQSEFKHFHTLLSIEKLNIEYIQTKELTKWSEEKKTGYNIHIHSLFKIKKNNQKRFIEIIKNLHNRQILSRIEIVLNKGNFKYLSKINYKDIRVNHIPKYNYYNLENKTDKEEIFKKGKNLYIKKSKYNNNQSLLNYILKYISKNNNSLEHTLLNSMGIKKITYSKQLKLKSNYNTKTISKKLLVKIVNHFHKNKKLYTKKQLKTNYSIRIKMKITKHKKSSNIQKKIENKNLLSTIINLIRTNRLLFNEKGEIILKYLHRDIVIIKKYEKTKIDNVNGKETLKKKELEMYEIDSNCYLTKESKKEQLMLKQFEVWEELYCCDFEDIKENFLIYQKEMEDKEEEEMEQYYLEVEKNYNGEKLELMEYF